MTGLTRKMPFTLGVCRSVPKRSSSVAGRNMPSTDRSSCVVLYVTYPGVGLLLSKGSRRSPNSCNTLSASAKMTTSFEPVRTRAMSDCNRKTPPNFDQSMESNYV